MNEAAATMGPIGRAMKQTRTELVSQDIDSIVMELESVFKVYIGDYLEYDQGHVSVVRRRGRIIGVESVYVNASGGHTASLKVVPLLTGGKIGCSRTVMI